MLWVGLGVLTTAGIAVLIASRIAKKRPDHGSVSEQWLAQQRREG